MLDVEFVDGTDLLLDVEAGFYRDDKGWHRAKFGTPTPGSRMEFKNAFGTRWFTSKVYRVSTPR